MTLKMKHIYRFVKQHGPATADHLATELKLPIDEILNLLSRDVAAGFIVKTGNIYSVKIFLDKPVSKTDGAHLYQFSEVQAAVPKPVMAAVKLTQDQIYRLLDVIFWWQGSRGSCCGHAGAIWKMLIYWAVTGDIPTVEQLRSTSADIVDQDIGCTAGHFRYIKQFFKIFSAQFLYDRSRKKGRIVYPAGSTCELIGKTIADEGAVTWNECLTAITGECAPELWPMVNGSYDETLAKLLPSANKHRNKFAATTDFDAVMDAIEQRPEHCVMGPINLGPDYMNPDSDGTWQNFYTTPIGSHALPWCLVNREARKIGCRESWDGDVTFKWNWIGEEYFKDQAGPFLIALTQEEALIVEEIYNRVMVTSTPAGADCILDGVKVGQTPCSVNLLAGVPHEITVSAAGYSPQSVQVAKDETPQANLNVILTPVPGPEPQPQPSKGLFQAIADFFTWLLNVILRKK